MGAKKEVISILEGKDVPEEQDVERMLARAVEDVLRVDSKIDEWDVGVLIHDGEIAGEVMVHHYIDDSREEGFSPVASGVMAEIGFPLMKAGIYGKGMNRPKAEAVFLIPEDHDIYHQVKEMQAEDGETA